MFRSPRLFPQVARLSTAPIFLAVDSVNNLVDAGDMTEAQAKQLGTLITRARERKGWSIRELAREVGADPAWVLKLERGKARSPEPEPLTRLAGALGIEMKRIDRITGRHVSKSLPEMRTYFRGAFNDLSDGDIDRIETLVAKLRREHGSDGG